jgi:hypothetical protein
MNKRYIIGCLAVWAFFFLSDGLLHGCLLKPFYDQTADLWRPEKEMCSKMPWIIAYEGVLAFLFGFIFTKGYERKGLGEGARYGWWIGLLFSASNLMWYAILPIPGTLALSWAAGMLAQLTLAGIIFAAIYKPAAPRF